MSGVDARGRQAVGPKFSLIRLPPDPLTVMLFFIPLSVFRCMHVSHRLLLLGISTAFAHEA